MQCQNTEIFFSLTSPSGTTVDLVTPLTYTGGNYPGVITVTFDDNAAAPVGGGTPVAGSFQPVGSLASFASENANGTWSLIAGDTVGFDPLCLYSWTLNLADAPAPAPAGLPASRFHG